MQSGVGNQKPFLGNLRSTLYSFIKSTPCNHCKLIDNGDVALYQITCPECGEVPQSRKHLYSGITNTEVNILLTNKYLKGALNCSIFIYIDWYNILSYYHSRIKSFEARRWTTIFQCTKYCNSSFCCTLIRFNWKWGKRRGNKCQRKFQTQVKRYSCNIWVILHWRSCKTLINELEFYVCKQCDIFDSLTKIRFEALDILPILSP